MYVKQLLTLACWPYYSTGSHKKDNFYSKFSYIFDKPEYIKW